MENLIWAVALWGAVFILIPRERIKRLWPVAVISLIMMTLLTYLFVLLGYYHFTKYLILFSGIPPFHVLGGSAGGILLMNWMPRDPLYKLLVVILFSSLFTLAGFLFDLLNVIKFTRGFNHFLDFFVNLAGISFLVWLSFALVGEETVYEGNKTNFTGIRIFDR